MFTNEVMKLVELTLLRSTLCQIVWSRWSINRAIEQCKRLAIAVEVVANPFIVFMNEPASGLVARAVAITMRSVRNIVDAGRTIVGTIH